MKAASRAIAAHQERWGQPDIVARAPGRVNLIGDHTDYNDGFTLPMALPFDTVIALSTTDSDQRSGPVTIESEGFGAATIDPTTIPGDTPAWAIHLAGVVSILTDLGIDSGGWSATIATDIPTGASLSSSAALEVAAITALLHRANRSWSPLGIARAGQRVENEIVGLPSGIMDQFISAGAIAGHASLMDCRALTLTPTPLPEGVAIAIADTGTRRVLADAAYADRRRSCEQAASDIGVDALRDATLDDLEVISDVTDRRRARHVITENTRTLAAAEAMTRGDAAGLGQLMTASHLSLRDDYEVSGPGLDAIVEASLAAPGCLGARMTGGGFAGCAVALVDTSQVDGFSDAVTSSYRYDGHEARIWICEPSAGAGIIAD
ncbi:MAG: galactokinase [Ilumatobacter coccineus]|uniref:Galactokinase n=1 Tax=Ilumatobacter coccineus TaxID=467094 RepID=A0A2G6K8S0_9ACTN|nr:MAG: galactokinase [Ilumatobacter coccineus]